MAVSKQKIRILSEGGEFSENELKTDLQKKYGEDNVTVGEGKVQIGENIYTNKYPIDGGENGPVVANSSEWSYTYHELESHENTGLTIIGYKGTIPENGVLTIPSVLRIDGKDENVVRIAGGNENQGYTGAAPFYPNGNVNKIIISSGISEICSNAFSNRENDYENLTEVIIPSSVDKIDTQTFDSCEKLNTVIIQDGVTTLGNLCFAGCTALKNINIPSSVRTIDMMAFNSSGIESLDCSNVNSIGAIAFVGCTNLKNIILPDIEISRDSNIFGDCENGLDSEMTQLTHIEYRGVTYNSVSEFYDAIN